ncbi:Hypothetical protein AA314_08921 [Archangium gephyra]|uniref:Uncharacterized protein n=1 Tax=Archangium gephyra TaxID=48 RepID=A0AAC8QHN4_9BACT|nr:Hypothetical protein AA314_08921 [Archangium gephyra]
MESPPRERLAPEQGGATPSHYTGNPVPRQGGDWLTPP